MVRRVRVASTRAGLPPSCRAPSHPPWGVSLASSLAPHRRGGRVLMSAGPLSALLCLI